MANRAAECVEVRALREGQIEEIHSAALRVLSDVGVDVADGSIRDLLVQHGARAEGRRVRFDAGMVEEALETAPARFSLHARGDHPPLDLGAGEVHLGTGGAAIRVLDTEHGGFRPSTLRDLGDLAWLVENLENIHFFLRPVIAQDVPKEELDENTLFACLANTQKHVTLAASSPESVDRVVQMASLLAGGQEEFRQRPFVSLTCSWMVSPLRVDTNVANVLRRAVEHGLPVALSSAPMAASTAPASLAGLLTQVHAEELSGVVLSQLFRPGAPVLYGPVPAAVSFRTMAYLGGAVESGLMNAAAVQLARRIGLPIYSDAGLTEAKGADVQAGYEKAANVMLVALAGGDFVHHAAGMLDSMLGVSYEQYVVDNDICGMALRAREGIRVDEETVAEELIAKVGPGGNFLSQLHTVKMSRSDEYFRPRTAVRDSLSVWETKGRVDARQGAQRIASEILGRERPRFIPEDVERRIRDEYRIRL
ncbi:MAG: trimethylamine methyltransferase family protein [Candidatus Bipolaricaulota bacterium]